ncbi:MAG: type I phosphomannose isomerase catalytic subunit [Gammaproteobacteria bacterium]
MEQSVVTTQAFGPGLHSRAPLPTLHADGVGESGSAHPPLYPLRFEPIYQYRLWGGRRLANLLRAPLPADGPVGEAWLLSDRDDHSSVVANGPLQGQTLTQLLDRWPHEMLGALAGRCRRFPLLLKFLDARDLISVQVHPSDRQTKYLPEGETGKTEAWLVLETGPDSIVYAGLEPGITKEGLQRAIENGTVREHLAHFQPRVGDGIFLRAGTVHALGDVVVFEVQQNSDVTFRLYDWDRVDATTGKARPLQVEQALACIEFDDCVVGTVLPTLEVSAPTLRERLFFCPQFEVWRIAGELPFTVGVSGAPRALVCIEGAGEIQHAGSTSSVSKGDVLLLPAVVGVCVLRPQGTLSVLEVSSPAGT